MPATGAPEGLRHYCPNTPTMNLTVKSFAATLASLLAVGALLIVGVAGSAARPISENPNPTTEECQPGQPYDENCPDIVTFAFPKHATVESGRFELVHLGCNQSCNHVIFKVKHGNKLVAKGATYPHGNYLPIIYAGVTPFAKKQLRQHGKLKAYAHVCVHPPGLENFCKGAKILLRAK